MLQPSLFERVLLRLHLLPIPIMDTFPNVLFGKALALAVRRGIFEALANVPRTAAEIASRARLSVGGTELLVQSFLQTGYLHASGNRYALTNEAKKWLLQDSPTYVGNLIYYFETLYGRWSYLEHSLEHGFPPRRYFDSFSDEDWRVYVYGMRDLARLLLPDVVKKILLPNAPRHLLDLGGSHGSYSIACCRRYPTLTATIIDFEEPLRHATSLIAEGGMTDRVHLCPGDFTRIDLPPEQDAVLLFNVIHGFSGQENQRLITRAMEALSPDGSLYILDQLRDKQRGRGGVAKFIPLMVGLNLLNEIGGNTYSDAEVRSWLGNARVVRTFRLRLPGVTLLEARR